MIEILRPSWEQQSQAVDPERTITYFDQLYPTEPVPLPETEPAPLEEQRGIGIVTIFSALTSLFHL